MLSLSPCPDCSRHVRVDDGACPFCGSTEARPAARRPKRRAKRLTRAALFLAGALGASACSTSAEEPAEAEQGEPSEADDVESMNDIYGGPPADDDEDLELEPSEEESAPAEAYGAPPAED